MIITDFVQEMKEMTVRELLLVSGGAERSERKVSFKAGTAHMLTLRGGAVEKAAITHLILKGVKPPQAQTEVNGMVYQMEIFPENPYCPMGHFNTEWTFAEKTLYYMNLDLFPALEVSDDLQKAKRVMNDVAGEYGWNTAASRQGLAEQYHMAHWPNPLSVGVGLQMKELTDADLDMFMKVYRTLFSLYVEILEKRKNQPFSAGDARQKMARNGRWLEYITIKDRAIKMAQAVGIPPEVIIGLSFPPSAVF